MTSDRPNDEINIPSLPRRYIRIGDLFTGACLAICATTAALLIVVNFAAGLFAGAINIPGASGLATGFTVPFFLVMVNLTTKRFGVITVTWTLYSTIAIPMYLMGPPNVFKPIFGLLIGLAFEVPILLLARSRFSYYIGLLAYTAAIVGMAYVAFALLNLPGAANALKYIWAIAAVFFVEGVIAVAMAHHAYARLFRGSRLDRFFSE